MSKAARESVRERAVSRMKVLAGTTATGVVVACGYAVVDPLPPPTCFESPRPGVSAKFVPAPSGQDAEDVRFVQVTITFSQTDGSSFSNATARESTGPSLDVPSQASRTGAYDFLVRVPNRVKSFTAQVSTSCPETQSARRTIAFTIDGELIDAQLY